MSNTMDTILVKYGVTGIDSVYDHSEHPEIKTVTLPEFLHLKPEELSEDERKIQEAARLIYDLNGKDPPIYKGFPTLDPQQPLVINCTGMYHVSAKAVFMDEKNEIGFINKKGDLVESFVHELKHAEQHAQLEIAKILKGNDNEAKKYIFYMDEAESIYTATMVCAETGHYDPEEPDDPMCPIKTYQRIAKECTDENGHKDMQKIKQRIMAGSIRMLSSDFMPVYPLQAEMLYPTLDRDKGLEKIPEHYGLPPDFLEALHKIPREARFNSGKIMACIANHREEQIPSLGIKKEERGYVLQNFFRDVYSNENSDKIRHTLLDLKDADGSPYFDAQAMGQVIIDAISGGKKRFDAIAPYFTDEQNRFPFTEKDVTRDGYNGILRELFIISSERIPTLVETLPIILSLKGKDGKALVSQESAAAEICRFCSRVKDPKDIIAIFDSIKDENGNLPFSREAFDIHDSKFEHRDGGNLLLSELSGWDEEDKERFRSLLPFLISLKDKEGHPIINQKNIECFSFPRDLSEDAKKAYFQQKENHHDGIKTGISGRLSRIDGEKNVENSDELTRMAWRKKLPQAGD